MLVACPGEPTLSVVGGACLNAVLGKSLKRVIKQPRWVLACRVCQACLVLCAGAGRGSGVAVTPGGSGS